VAGEHDAPDEASVRESCSPDMRAGFSPPHLHAVMLLQRDVREIALACSEFA